MKKMVTPYLLLVPQIILSLLFIIGLATGITQSLGVIPAFGLKEPTLKYYREVLSRPEMLKSVLYSLRVAFLSAGIATAAGVGLSAVCVMHKKTKGLMMRVIQLPIIVPHVVVAIFMVNIFSQNGVVARLGYALGLLQEQQQFPYFVIALMANINEKLGEAAINLGADRWTAFCKVTLPLCKDAVISGFLIIFVFSLGAYELPFLLGATSPRALPVLAYQQYIHPDLKNRPYAMALNGIIILLSVLSAWIYYFIMRKNMKALMEQ